MVVVVMMMVVVVMMIVVVVMMMVVVVMMMVFLCLEIKLPSLDYNSHLADNETLKSYELNTRCLPNCYPLMYTRTQDLLVYVFDTNRKNMEQKVG